jgi:ATP-dependent helicase/nuclease subunit A
MTPPDPQAEAADPAGHRFVTANAGSGKTKTLIDRVARLLLSGAQPAAILCVTYTKAAAAEMQRRLYDRLGKWAVLEQDALRTTLAELQGRSPASFDDETLRGARALFARALEAPGGLKIQTIHAFCEALLRRFPLEADIAPGFTVMDDAQAAAIVRSAREQVALAANADDADLSEAYARLSVALDFDSFQAMFAAFESQRGALLAYFRQMGGDTRALVADIWSRCGFEGPTSAALVEAEIMALLDRPLWKAAGQALLSGPKTIAARGETILTVAHDPAATFEAACGPFFTDKGEPAKWVETASPFRAREDLRDGLLAQQALLAEGRERLAAVNVAEMTVMALTLAAAYVGQYAGEKKRRGVLDFADLIERTHQLLNTREDAAWVLYKLDGGIDHLLLDEAQDTAHEQWEIIKALTDEFGVGAGARNEGLRTLFVVGDVKQSIYSFQGANPDLFLARRAAWMQAFTAAGIDAKSIELTTSYRSTPQVLKFVDQVFVTQELRRALSGDGAEIAHEAFRAASPGCVDLWELHREPPQPERDAWTAPVDQPDEHNANRQLADQIAAEIKALVARGDAVGEGKDHRPARYGDVLILVRRRGVLFEEILRALKRAEVPVAGADRLKLSGHIAFDDLVALARFCLYPDDDLTLAALLKSPLTGLDDDDIYALAHRRTLKLWGVLQARANENPRWAQALAFLNWARTQARATAPFEFFNAVLDHTGADGRSMRQAFLARLGPEAQDALIEFLAQVAAAEQRGVRELESLTADFAGLDIVVKREMDAARGEVRVMTAHGAKGLEAPIVILPEVAFPGGGRMSPLLRDPQGGFLWCSSKTADCAASSAARGAREQAEADEALRLLYVALTRARDRLILCGRISATAKLESLKGWYRALSAAFLQADLTPHLRQGASGDLAFTRYGPDPVALGPAPSSGAAPAVAAEWTRAPPPPESPTWRFAQPSTAAESERGPAPSPLATAGGLGRFRRGELIHRLLQLLPDVAAQARPAAAARLLAFEPGVSAAQRDEMIAAALGVLGDAAFADVFGPGSRAEAAIAGTAPNLPADLRISGRVDRLLVTPDRVLVADFKTNRPAPAVIGAADHAYIRQMALYWAVLKGLFPGRRVEAALVWTDGPKLMPVPEELMVRALESLS